MSDLLSWSQAGTVLVLVGGMFGFYRWLNAMQIALMAKLDEAINTERMERIALERNMSQFRESAMRMFVTNDSFRDAKGEIVVGIDKIGIRLDKLDVRMEHLVEHRSVSGRPPRTP